MSATSATDEATAAQRKVKTAPLAWRSYGVGSSAGSAFSRRKRGSTVNNAATYVINDAANNGAERNAKPKVKAADNALGKKRENASLRCQHTT